jgi:hypothetical protein
MTYWTAGSARRAAMVASSLGSEEVSSTLMPKGALLRMMWEPKTRMRASASTGMAPPR